MPKNTLSYMSDAKQHCGFVKMGMVDRVCGANIEYTRPFFTCYWNKHRHTSTSSDARTARNSLTRITKTKIIKREKVILTPHFTLTR
jgi:hypothetical protein